MSIATELARLRRAKNEIKEAIEDKGVDVPNDKRLDDYDDYVKMIRAATDPLEWGKIIGNIEDQEDLMELLSSLVHYEIYADLSEITDPRSSILYLIGPSGDGEDEYEEYVYDSTKNPSWIKIGDTSVDLSGYVTTQALNTALANYTTTANLNTLLAAKYEKPSTGIPSSDMASAVQTSLGKADTAYQKPGTGIPATDLASGVIPDVSAFITKSVNDLTNYYLKSETYAKTEVDAIVGAIQGFSYESVASLPTASASTMGKIYLVPSANAQAQNVKDEFITIESGGSYSWEQIGSTAIDLSGYVTTSALNTALASYTTTADLTTLLAAKQDTIADLATIRSGAALGATAVQPGDLPTVPTISTDIETDKASNTKTASPKAVADYVEDSVVAVSAPVPNDGTIIFTHRNGDTDTVDLNHNHPQYALKVGVETTQPVGGMIPNTLYNLGTLTGAVTFSFAAPENATIRNEYMFTFDSGSTAVVPTWPVSITAWQGNCIDSNGDPVIAASKHYEVSVLGGIGFIAEV